MSRFYAKKKKITQSGFSAVVDVLPIERFSASVERQFLLSDAARHRAELAVSAFELLAVGYVGLVVVQIVVGHLLSLVPTYVPRLVS